MSNRFYLLDYSKKKKVAKRATNREIFEPDQTFWQSAAIIRGDNKYNNRENSWYEANVRP